MGDQRRALDQLERAYPDLLPEARSVVSLQAVALAVRATAPLDGLRWLARARADAPDRVVEQTKLLEVALRMRALTSLTPLDGVERAVASEDWQAAYDAALTLPARGAAAYTRLLLVAAQLRSRGAADAALQLLDRALDALPTDAGVYWELMRTLSDLG